MSTPKQIVFTTLTVIGDGIITFIVFFLLVIGFGTTESIRCRIGDDKSLEEVENACREYISYFNAMFLTEIIIGLLVIVLSNYFIFKALFKRPLIATLIVLTAYLTITMLIYNNLYQNYIDRNLERLTC